MKIRKKSGLLPNPPRTPRPIFSEQKIYPNFFLLKIASITAETNLHLVPLQKQINFLYYWSLFVQN